jgi:hypothetical protein
VEICLGQYVPTGVKIGVLQWPNDTPRIPFDGCDLWSRWGKSIDGVRDLDQLTCEVWTVFAVAVGGQVLNAVSQETQIFKTRQV